MRQATAMQRSLELLLVVLASFAVTHINSECVFKGKCAVSDYMLGIPCVTENGAKHTNKLKSNATFTKLRSICPDFLQPDGMFCCDDDQVELLVAQFSSLALILERCPSCYFNLARIFCHMTCSPDQSKFIEVTASQNATIPSDYGKKAVANISYYLETDYINRAYASCAEVQNPQSGPALTLLCGRLKCSPKNLLKAIGTGSFAPFPIAFTYEAPPGFELFNHSSTKCSEPPFEGRAACGCTDCTVTCPPFPVPDENNSFCILNLDGFYVVFGLLFILLVAAFEAYWILWTRSGKFDPTQDEVNLVPSLSDHETVSAKQSPMNAVFEKIGIFCASRPWTVITIGVLLCLVFSLGNLRFKVTTDPVELWSAPNSVARIQKEYYDKRLGPFYRVEQVMILNKGGEPFVYDSKETQQSYKFSPIFRQEFIAEVLNLQEQITNLTGLHDNGTSVEEVHLEDICFSPLRHKCAIQSVPNWFQNNISNVENNPEKYLDHIVDCINNPTLVAKQDSIHLGCLGEFGGPSFYYAALGGYESDNPLMAPAMVLTFLVRNNVEAEKNERAIAWETEFVKFLKKFTHPNMTIAFMAESSINSELNLESRSDISTIVISYLLMFLYVSIVLGRYKSVATILIHSQIVLGAMGVMLVLASVVSSIGIYSFLGVPSTLIIFEVVPFLVLAIGVDNIFILVQAYQRSARLDGESLEEHIGRILSAVGPSMLMASASEVTCFFLGALTSMPAVKTFALYAALALLVDFLLQITVFVAMLALDIRRQETARLDLFCCLKTTPEANAEDFDHSMLYRFMKNVYSPLLRKPAYRNGIIVAFVAVFCLSASVVHKLDVGLDQEISMPENSYLQDYFRFLKEYMRVGPPVYFVVSDKFNYNEPQNQNLIGAFTKAAGDSLVNDIKQASRSANKTFIAAPAMSWIDDYFSWTRSCCLENNVTHVRCFTNSVSHGCLPCPKDTVGRPPNMTTHIEDFLNDLPSQQCAKGGHAAYSNAVQITPSDKNPGNVEIGATSFMTYHSILKGSADYIEALKMGRYVASQIEKSVKKGYKGNPDDVEIFPYSIFYVFYEQYLTIWADAATHILLSFAGVSVITLVFLKFNFLPTIAICVTILMIVVDLMGVMYFAKVSLNAVSLVNLVMCVGISVEFCSHIVKAYVDHSQTSPVERAISAVANTGSSVLSGITCTKFVGVAVLAFANSQLFVVFYFRMYLAIVLIGSIHGLVFLPVFLAVFGSLKKEKRSCN